MFTRLETSLVAVAVTSGYRVLLSAMAESVPFFGSIHEEENLFIGYAEVTW